MVAPRLGTPTPCAGDISISPILCIGGKMGAVDEATDDAGEVTVVRSALLAA